MPKGMVLVLGEQIADGMVVQECTEAEVGPVVKQR